MKTSTRMLAVIPIAVAGFGCSRTSLKARETVARPVSSAPVAASVDGSWNRAAKELLDPQSEVVPASAPPRGSLIRRGYTSSKRLLLTFDDGPHPKSTPKLLSILAKNGIKATFFVVGEMAARHPDLIRQISAAGHTIGNHSYHHRNLALLSVAEARAEYRATDYTIEQIAGIEPLYCRPPGGRFDRAVVCAAAAEGLKTVLWTDNTADYLNPSDKAYFRKAIGRLSPGGILLLHDGSKATLRLLPALIARARELGYEFVTPETMLVELQKHPQRSQPLDGWLASNKGLHRSTDIHKIQRRHASA